MRTVFVTCMYNDLSESVYGGRNRAKMYKHSLKSMAALGYVIYCFVSPKTILLDKQMLNDEGIDNIILIPYDLFSSEMSDRIMQVKAADVQKYYGEDDFWQHRCVQLMWNKTRMLADIIQKCGRTIDNIFWIDAGLSNASTIRHRYFPHANELDHYNSTGLFIPRFVYNLVNDANGKIYCMLHTRPNNFRIPESYNVAPYSNDDFSMIGGLFGGNVGYVKIFTNKFEEYIDKMLDTGMLYAEESAYTGIFSDYPELFSPVWFDTFYHEDWGDVYNPDHVTFSSKIEHLLRTEQP